ncbi:hypothetical protein [Deinococcus ruber]|uniref:Uncharacterized protein n=1 Tax=Deinococcus ruber TaxID=1848197 RepID=A0A918C725_9DEIO|nr:hypothetical protein [Deinococcus ruber]GGR09969.1 hypothetical protein GCM10008957_23430 [Deinococcus ruber]
MSGSDLPLSRRQDLFRDTQRAEQDAWLDVNARTFDNQHIRDSYGVYGADADRIVLEMYRHEALLDAAELALQHLAARYSMTEDEVRAVALEGVLNSWSEEIV